MESFSKSDFRILSQIGLNAGEVAFASLFASLFVDKGNLYLVLSSLVLTIVFWGSSWFLSRKFRL